MGWWRAGDRGNPNLVQAFKPRHRYHRLRRTQTGAPAVAGDAEQHLPGVQPDHGVWVRGPGAAP
jgi:hypothetical protein